VFGDEQICTSQVAEGGGLQTREDEAGTMVSAKGEAATDVWRKLEKGFKNGKPYARGGKK